MDDSFWTTIISFYGHHYHCIVDLPEKIGMISKDKNDPNTLLVNKHIHITMICIFFLMKFE